MSHEKRYLQVYQHFKDLILSGALQPDSRMPSLRACSEQLQYSRTTVETAYLMLAADGYLYSRPQSGYYVTDIALAHLEPAPIPKPAPVIRYDFTTSASATDSQTFELWRRYVKSALRQDDRLASYGEPQGEAELRQVLASYIQEHRNVFCSPDSIVIGAGIQSLLNILCPLLPHPAAVSFPDHSFRQGMTIFENFGYDLHIKDKDADVVYVMPAHMTPWGSIMPVKRRMELVRHAAARGSLILEDDYENEFVSLQKPTPSLQSLAGGKGVVYLSSFSRMLLPSVRISFMVLPPELKACYDKRKDCYNQTASKTEQIALCQYIRDGHLDARIRKLRRVYDARMHRMIAELKRLFGTSVSLQTGSGGFTLAMTLPLAASAEQIISQYLKAGIRLRAEDTTDGKVMLFLSCSALSEEVIGEACQALWEVLFS